MKIIELQSVDGPMVMINADMIIKIEPVTETTGQLKIWLVGSSEPLLLKKSFEDFKAGLTVLA